MTTHKAEVRAVSESVEDLEVWAAIMKRVFPNSVMSPIKRNDARPGWRIYQTCFYESEELEAKRAEAMKH